MASDATTNVEKHITSIALANNSNFDRSVGHFVGNLWTGDFTKIPIQMPTIQEN